ncbi:alpha/beta hydrolase [Yeosuana sp. MJ-SS3]|uniref:Alpha/beta hydrolase n=1 Tax=Gilvirhabdus luticola TaxID=3079858 RepID=A0ABU3U2H5_9FLAO|nr:alpha/beta hydrolase [Yeosuana sp. MJ-SS3]MDU8884546.1 alpha/beta hydrolase [Yeosuana sp. MJ-SS3]
MIYGKGPPVIMLPGLAGSGIEQFAKLGPNISEKGYTVVLVDPRGVGDSTGSLDSLTLHHFANDVSEIINQLDLGKAVIIGKAYGNRVARCVATDYPQLTRSVILISAGGIVPASTDVLTNLIKYIFGHYSNDEERLELLQKTMFSPKSDVNVYPKMSFYTKARDAQIGAIQSTPTEEWWLAGNSPVLIIQGLDDVVAIPENGRILKKQLGDRAELVEIADAGHFLHLEQPKQVLESIIDYIKKNELGVAKIRDP